MPGLDFVFPPPVVSHYGAACLHHEHRQRLRLPEGRPPRCVRTAARWARAGKGAEGGPRPGGAELGVSAARGRQAADIEDIIDGGADVTRGRPHAMH